MTRLSKFKLLLKEEKTEYEVDQSVEYTSPESIAKLALEFTDLKSECEEYVYCIAFDTHLHVLGFYEVAHGSQSKCAFPMKNVFQKALFLGANRIVMVHNHPSGSCEASVEDVSVTERVKKAGKLIDIELLDHIIVTPNCECYSIAFKNRWRSTNEKS